MERKLGSENAEALLARGRVKRSLPAGDICERCRMMLTAERALPAAALFPLSTAAVIQKGDGRSRGLHGDTDLKQGDHRGIGNEAKWLTPSTGSSWKSVAAAGRDEATETAMGDAGV